MINVSIIFNILLSYNNVTYWFVKMVWSKNSNMFVLLLCSYLFCGLVLEINITHLVFVCLNVTLLISFWYHVINSFLMYRKDLDSRFSFVSVLTYSVFKWVIVYFPIFIQSIQPTVILLKTDSCVRYSFFFSIV